MENFILIGLCVGLGILFRRIETFPDTTAQALNMFALYVSLSAVILLKVPQLHVTAETLVPALLPWGMLLLSALLVLAVGKRYGWPRRWSVSAFPSPSAASRYSTCCSDHRKKPKNQGP